MEIASVLTLFPRADALGLANLSALRFVDSAIDTRARQCGGTMSIPNRAGTISLFTRYSYRRKAIHEKNILRGSGTPVLKLPLRGYRDPVRPERLSLTEVLPALFGTKSRDYSPPDDIYTARLTKLLRDDRRKAKGEVGCLEFDYWVDGQDYMISRVTVTSADEGPDRKTVVAKFLNFQISLTEIHYDFRRMGGRWLLDDVHSTLDPTWTLSEILKCTP